MSLSILNHAGKICESLAVLSVLACGIDGNQ